MYILNPEGLQKVDVLAVNYLKVMVAEFLFTFVLMWVILNVAIAQGTAGNGFYGIAIGAIVAAGAYAVGPISFAAFNPAVTLALCLNGFLPWTALPVYWITQAVAAAAAGLLFKSMRITDDAEYPGTDCPAD
jgi:aquaporin Z